MSNELSNEVKRQIFSQESDDPFLTLVTLSSTSAFIRLVNNSSDIVSNGQTFTAFPMRIKTPQDDGETTKDFSIEFDNVSLDLITSLRSVTDSIGVKIELILASMPDVIQMSYEDLSIKTISYNQQRISAKIILDSFLAVTMTSEKYVPSLYPSLF